MNPAQEQTNQSEAVDDQKPTRQHFDKHETDFLLIFLPILAALALFLLVVSDKYNIKLIGNNFLKKISYQGAETTGISSVTPAIQDEIAYSKAEPLFKKLSADLKATPGVYGLYIKDLGSGKEFKYAADTEAYGASLYKLGVAIATLKNVEKGEIKLSDTITYLPLDYASGTGVINTYEYGIQLKVSDILSELIKNSDNTAQNMLMRTLMYKNVEDAFNHNVPDTQTSTFYKYDLTTPIEVGYMLENIYYGNYLKSANRQYLIDLMTNTSFDDKISAYLTKGLIFAHKIGTWPYTWHDCGIVFTNDKRSQLVVCLMSQKATYEDFLTASKLTAEFVNSILGSDPSQNLTR